MRILEYIEVDIDYCSLEYGIGACPAVLGVDSRVKCFNTWKTCAVRDAFTLSVKTVRFAIASEYLPGDIPCFPSIEPNGIAYTSQVIEPGKSMGKRASLSVTLIDHPDGDTFFDKYHAERLYNPREQGTFWGKWRARNPFVKGRPLRYIRGVLGQAYEEMEVRHLIIETTDGPGADGRFKITAKDILKIADGDRAQAPKKSNGVLLSDLAAGEGSFTLDPAGIGDLEYPADGEIAIGEEMMTFTRAGDVMTITRGEHGTEDSDHNDGDLVQLVLVYSGEKPENIIEDLLLNYADGDADQIPIEEWHQEIDQYINRVYTGRIAKPTAVSALINELIEQVGLNFWVDDIANLIRMRSLRPVTSGDLLVNDDSLIAGTLQPTEQPDKRVSQAWTSFAQINPLEDLDRQSNFASGVATVDGQSEIDYGMPAIYKVNSRWLDRFNRSGAERLNSQILSRYRDPPRKFVFACHRDSVPPKIGLGFRLRSRYLQGPDGAPEIVMAVVTALQPLWDRYIVTAEEMLFFQRNDLEDQRLIVIDQNATNINLLQIHNTIYNAPEGGESVLFVIQNAVIVGGSNAQHVSITVGDWPPGCILTLTSKGRMAGAGGRGGGYQVNDGVGEAGGTAFYTRYPITIDNTDGIIAGGGGGGGAGWKTGGHCIGGGGGAGYLRGPHGVNSMTAATAQAEGWYLGTDATLTNGGIAGYSDEIVISGHNNNYQIVGQGGGAPGEAGVAGFWRPFGTDSRQEYRAGGAAGIAVDGDSYITWTALGSIIGARIN